MSVYIALLRGINVGGNNLIKMAELKRMFESIGLTRVQTYIISGNILFESNEGATELRLKIEAEIKAVFNISLIVVLRTAEQWEKIMAACPYDADKLSISGSGIHVSLLIEPLSTKQLETLSNQIGELDKFHIHGHEIYFFYGQSILDSKLAKNLQKLGGVVTSRNWNTMNKIAALAKAMQG